MQKRSFWGSFLISLLAVLLLAAGVLVYAAGESEELFDALLLPTAVMAVLLISFAVGASAFLSYLMVRPVRKWRADRREALPYPELSAVQDAFSATKREVADRKNALTEKESEILSITASMSEGMVILSGVGEILLMNDAAKEAFGIESAPPKTVLALAKTPGLRAAVSTALAGGQGYDSFRKNGRFYSVLATPVFRDGQADGAVLVLLDETEKEAREDLRREFTSNVSHELKTPLTAISGFAELIRDGMTDGEETRTFAEKIHKESGRLVALVEDIIRLNRLDGGEIPVDAAPVDLSALAETVAERFLPIAERAGLTLTVNAPAKAFVVGNSGILSEMVGNLIDNAVKYNREGGAVTVTVDGAETPLLSVRDTGIGISCADMPRIFERFYRVDKSRSKEVGGTGLGLSIVKHGASYHGAALWVDSDVGVGTTVYLKFPKRDFT